MCERGVADKELQALPDADAARVVVLYREPRIVQAPAKRWRNGPGKAPEISDCFEVVTVQDGFQALS